jgi:hypothetical protein
VRGEKSTSCPASTTNGAGYSVCALSERQKSGEPGRRYFPEEEKMRRPLLALSALTVAAVAAPAGAAGPATLESALIAMEKQSWVAWKAHDGAFFERYLSDDHVEVGPSGPAAKADVVRLVSSGKCTIASYSVDHFVFRRVAIDTAVLTYRAEQATRCGAASVPSPVWATSVYVRRGGRWRNAVYVHSPAPAG